MASKKSKNKEVNNIDIKDKETIKNKAPETRLNDDRGLYQNPQVELFRAAAIKNFNRRKIIHGKKYNKRGK